MNMSVTGVTSGAVYPTGVLTRTDAGMDVFLYPSAGMGVTESCQPRSQACVLARHT